MQTRPLISPVTAARIINSEVRWSRKMWPRPAEETWHWSKQLYGSGPIFRWRVYLNIYNSTLSNYVLSKNAAPTLNASFASSYLEPMASSLVELFKVTEELCKFVYLSGRSQLQEL